MSKALKASIQVTVSVALSFVNGLLQQHEGDILALITRILRTDEKSCLLLVKKSSNQFSQSSLDPNFFSLRKLSIRGKGCNLLVPGPDYMVDALKLRKQAPRGHGELLQKYVFWRCPDGTQHLFCWPILAISGQ
ncbi:hypothetical protein TNCV_1821021 [Trichonephila clavipes]|nr:hypothetical protein TNCV_1821021 [Trichonephila clavipes]